ncbi:FAD-dependent oxidoreductase [Mycobacterium sp. KBS0706]|uniref:NAD(P)/FAD-dependent oxidoreductase n=1 Tax=Mycobacterium sp. KBS0706 TaxID=2578109 RepID=UPI00110F9DEF|nr:FAD-dependent oxidoreductase [Mycobacterium sp. KBS0706]TSD90312.1 FAD-dependent oxidoreductase [Mycobacterium sp. KBS0706]
MPSIIVIGAGVIGASVAYRLAQGGASVTVLEATRIGAGTSGTSFAWVNSHGKTPRAYHDLNVAGMKAHAALRDEFAATPWLHLNGSLEWADEAGREEQRQRFDRLREWGYAAEWISPAQLRELAPDIDPAAVGDAPVAWFQEEGWVDPVVYAQAMLAAARRLGARVEIGARVAQVELRSGRVSGVTIADGRTLGADLVVNCTGRWADDFDPALHIPLAPTAGLLAFTPPVAVGLERLLKAPGCDIRPDGAGRLLVCRNDDEFDPATAPRPGVDLPEMRELIRKAQAILPAMGPVEPEAVRLGIRAIPKDGYSAVGPLPQVEGYYAAVTHSGVTLAAVLGAAVADELLRGAVRPELATFRPARFFG